jgi:MFS family permease
MTAPAPPSATGAASVAAEPKAGVAAWYLIFVLTVAYTASFVDRQVLNLLVGPIKADFGLTDTRLSLLQGIAFTLSYIALSPVFGRLADTSNRRNILIGGIVLWSIGTACCGLARSYTQLFLARFGVGGAEACLTPASWSIITDSFRPAQIPRAFSVYMMGPYLGGGFALIFGGLLLGRIGQWDLAGIPLLGSLAPWQLVFVLVGLPGVVIAVLLRFVKEPPRHDLAPDAVRERMTLGEVGKAFWEQRGFYGNFYLGMSCIVIILYGFPAWMPTVLIRRFGASAGEVGLQYGLTILVTGSIGVLAGPWMAGLLTRRGRTDALLLIPTVMAALIALASASLALAGSYRMALAIGALTSFLYSLPQALAAAALQIATPNRMRGIASSVYVFAVSIIGLGAAPTIVAVLTDHLFHDEKRVGEALALACTIAALLGCFFLSRALRAYRRMVA